jgi:predicted ATP-dependent protease
MIPHQNIGDLMLRKDLVEAVSQGKFRIYPVQTIDQGVEILTGFAAGERKPDGTYPEGTVNDRVNKKLIDLAKGMKAFEGEEEKKGQ